MWFNNFVPINALSMSGTSINPEKDNTEYELKGWTFKEKPVYYQWFNHQKRVSTTIAGLIDGVDTLLSCNLTMQGLSNGSTPSGTVYFLPYIHTNSIAVILQMNGDALQIKSQASGFAGNYQISGLIVYTKTS